MKVSEFINHLEAFKREYGDVTVDIITETHWTHEELIQHMVWLDEMVVDGKGAGIQTEQTLGDIAYSPEDKSIKVLPKGF